MEQRAPPGLALNSVRGEYNYEKFADLFEVLLRKAKEFSQDRTRNIRRSHQ
jgi:hypothetical protein